MFERFSDRGRKVMTLANQEAQRLNHEYINTEHILLGIIKEGGGVGANVLKNLTIDLEKLRLGIEKLLTVGPEMVTMGRIPRSDSAKKSIKYAIEEARNLNHIYVGTEHLLLGLLREPGDFPVTALTSLGLRITDIREEVLSLLGIEDPPKPDKHPEKEVSPEFNDHDVESILAWWETKIIVNEKVDSDDEISYSLVWKPGLIHLEVSTEAEARKAGALFIYLWTRGVQAGIAERCATAYVRTYTVRRL